MQKEFLRLANQRAIDELLVQFGPQRKRRQRLSLSSGENRAAMRSGQVIHFRPNRTDICWLAPIQTSFFIEQQISDGLLLHRTDVLTQHESLFISLLIGERLHEGVFDGLERSFAFFFRLTDLCRFVEWFGQCFIDTRPQIFIVVLMRILSLNTIMSCAFRQRNLRFTLCLNCLVRSFDGIHHLVFAHLRHLALHHDNAIHASRNHHIHVRAL